MQILLQANEASSAQQTVWVKCTAATRSKQIQQLSSDLILGSLEIKYEKNSLGESSKKGVTNVNPASGPPPPFDENKTWSQF